MAFLEYLKLIPVGWSYGWWFSVAFGLVNLFFILKYPRHFLKRLLKFPSFESKFEKVISFTSVIVFMRGMMIYTIFVVIDPLKTWFFLGLPIFLTGLVFYIAAMKAYAETDINVPVTTGVYKITRHPMQIFSILMWIGVGMASTSWIILVICLAQPVLTFPFLKCQERFCLQKYGDEYAVYLTKTPRYLLI